MAKKIDPNITFLDKFGDNVVKLPRVGIGPIDVMGKDDATHWAWTTPVALEEHCSRARAPSAAHGDRRSK
jgi:hypothetical protein